MCWLPPPAAIGVTGLLRLASSRTEGGPFAKFGIFAGLAGGLAALYCLLPHLRETDPGRVFDAASCPNAWPDAAPSVAKSDRHHGSEKKRKIDPDV